MRDVPSLYSLHNPVEEKQAQKFAGSEQHCSAQSG